MSRVYNFSAGPSTLPEVVLEKAKAQLVDYDGAGMSVMEMSHRSPEFLGIARQAEQDLRDLMKIPDNYKVLFLQGGATGQFAAIPLNLAEQTDTADYVITGMWGKKAHKEAQKYLQNANIAAMPDPYTSIPDQSSWHLSPGSKYLHITVNETIHGVAFNDIPDTGDVPLVGDISSTICSRPLDVSKFGVLYAGAQKNLGPAGLTVVVVRDDLLDTARGHTPAVWHWADKSAAESMLNTPPTYSWYMAGLILDWLKNDIGGLDKMAAINKRKAAKLYKTIDDSDFYANPVEVKSRSLMNVPFTLAKPDLDKTFLEQAAEQGLVNLGGHRSVGGMRASIYNAIPEAGVDALIKFMKEFEAKHG
ncbi:MAG: 3-phosphoserine/phosphohydroxythreonine transaminase [Patescibacteria group bacterium]